MADGGGDATTGPKQQRKGQRRNVPKFITHVQGIVLLNKSYYFMTSSLPSSAYLLTCKPPNVVVITEWLD